MPSPLIRSDTLSLITVICSSIEQALKFYVGTVGFNLKCDEEINGERFVVAMPTNLVEFTPTASLRFREAKTPRDKRAVGNQGGDGVFLQVETDDWEKVYDQLKSFGARLLSAEPREEVDYRAVTVLDPMGNKVVIVERTTTAMGRVFTRDVGY